MLTSQGNTQVYSPFGSYVVEQHDSGFDKPPRYAVPEQRLIERPAARSNDLPKAA